METSALLATIDLFIKTDQELAKTIFEHRITGNCLSIFSSNGTTRKCQKSKALQKIHWKCVDYSKYIAIVDMDYCGDCQHHFHLTEKKVMGQSTQGKIIETKFSN